MAIGSAFWHGSHTFLGSIFDNDMIYIITMAAGQAAISWSDSPILNNWSETEVYKPAKDIINEITEMIAEEPVNNWAGNIRGYNFPFYKAMVGFNLNIAYIVLPYWVTQLIINMLGSIPIFEQTDEEIRFWSEVWLPEIDNALKDVPISLGDSIELGCAAVGYFMKAILAILM